MRKPTPAPAQAAAPEPVNHRADAAQVFMAQWLPSRGVSANAFSAADAEALVSAIDAGSEAAG